MTLIEEKKKRIIEEMEAGRGSSEIFSYPVTLEPSFSLFNLRPQKASLIDNLVGRRKRPLPQMIKKADSKVSELNFISVNPSREDKNSLEAAEQFIISLPSSHPISFEIIGIDNRISFQFVVPENDSHAVCSQLRTYFPGADVGVLEEDALKSALPSRPTARVYRLKSSHFFPFSLVSDKALDPLGSLYGMLGNLKNGQLGALQVLFAPVAHDWQDNMSRASRNPYDQSSPFTDLPNLPKLVDRKIAKPLYAVSLRLIAANENLLSDMERFLKQFESADNGWEMVRGVYPYESIISRNTNVHGAILNLEETALLVHLPASDVIESIPAIHEAKKSYSVPEEYMKDGPVLGVNMHRGEKRDVYHSRYLPNQHVYSAGKSGYGKSNLILSSALQRICNNQGIGVVDPHGSLITQGILPRIPKERVNDVILFDAGDFDYPIAINPLAHSGTKIEKEHIRTDLLNFFEDLFEAPLGVSIMHTMTFALSTLLIRHDSTLFDLERLLIDRQWRKEIVDSLEDERMRSFWELEFPQLEKKGITTAILNKLSPLLLPDSTIAPMLRQRENKIDFRKIMDESRILLVNLSHGAIGKRNSQLLGKLLVSKLQIAAMMREGEGKCPDFYLYIDEFQHMVCPSMADILSGARKYGLHLWLANQMTGDIPDSILRHVFNASTLIFFATDSPSDQSVFEKTLLRRFAAEDIGRLKKGETFVKMVSSVFNMTTERVSDPPAMNYVDEIIFLSRERYAVRHTQTENIDRRKVTEEKTVPEIQSSPQVKAKDSNNTIPSPFLTPQEKSFLECVLQNPTLTVTGIYRNQNLSPYMGDKIKSILKDKGLIKEVTTHLGQGGRIAKFLLLAPSGFEALNIGFDEGKGGVLHRCWQSSIKFYAEAVGYEVRIEEPLTGSKETVDLGLSRKNMRIAVEISITTKPEHEVGNIRKCLEAGYTKVVLLLTEEDKLNEFLELSKKAFTEDEQQRITAGLVYDFCRFLS